MDQAISHLKQADPVLAKLIAQYPLCTIAPHTDYYAELLSSIIGQQLSVRVAEVLCTRVKDLYSGVYPEPQAIIQTDTEALRSLGISYAKIRYIKDLAEHVADGRLDLKHISSLSNDEVVTELTAVKGIGEWTAHMFLIFSVGRLDVLPVGDLGTKKAVLIQYGLKELPTAEDIRTIAKQNKWAPYESVATWYLWRSLENKPVTP